MESRIEVHFSNFSSDHEFRIENPSMLPCEGEIFSCEWSDYIADDKLVKELKEFEENSIFIVNILHREYKKARATLHIVLYNEEHYEGPLIKVHK